jgi:hypothetical protein
MAGEKAALQASAAFEAAAAAKTCMRAKKNYKNGILLNQRSPEDLLLPEDLRELTLKLAVEEEHQAQPYPKQTKLKSLQLPHKAQVRPPRKTSKI